MRAIVLIALVALIATYFGKDVYPIVREMIGLEPQSESQPETETLIEVATETETEPETKTAYQNARDILNGTTNIQPSFIEIGQYQPAYMSDDMNGIWLEYQARSYNSYGLVPHYFRLRDLNRIVLGQTASGVCQLKLTGPESEIGYFWEESVGWERGLATLFFRSSDCEFLTQAGEAFVELIKLDGGRSTFSSSLD